jgi:autotransporter-associated beta strand protein
MGVGGPITFMGGTLGYSGVNSDLSSRFTAFGSGVTAKIDIGLGTLVTYSDAPLTGDGGLLKLGGGTLALGANATYTGVTTIAAGTLAFGVGATGGTAGMVIGDIANSGLVLFNRSDSIVYSSTISGSGGIEKAGSGELTLNGVQVYGGSTTFTAGTMRVISAGSIGSGSFVFNGGRFTTSGNSALSFANELLFTGSSSFGDTNASYAGALTFSGDGVLTGNRSVTIDSPVTMSGVLSGTYGLTKAGNALLTLSGVNTYSGATNVNAGTLSLSGTVASTVLSVASGATLNAQNGSVIPTAAAVTANGLVNLLNSAVTLQTLLGNGTVALNTTDLTLSNGTFGGGINGTGTLVKTSGGLLTLSGSNGYDGATSVNVGTLTLSGTLASTVLGVSSGATLNAQSGSVLPVATVLTADGLVNLANAAVTLETLLGAGTLALNTTALTLSNGTFSGAINGTGSLLKTSNGLLSLSGSNA